MTVTSPYDIEVFVNVTKSILNSIVAVMEDKSRDVPARTFVGFDRPAEDYCPDLVAWMNNVRPYDGNGMESGLVEGRLLCFNAWAFDVTIRLGRCYIDFDADGGPLDGRTIEDWSNELYRDAQVVYIGWVNQWRTGTGACAGEELESCDPMNVGPLINFKEGGCAGWEFTITVGVL